MLTMRKTALMIALGAAAATPIAAKADPAVGAPTIPPIFNGAPTNQDPRAGQFQVNFDSTGRYLGLGNAPEPPLTIDVKPVRERRQTVARGSAPTLSEQAETDREFVVLRHDLQQLTTPVMALAPR